MIMITWRSITAQVRHQIIRATMRSQRVECDCKDHRGCGPQSRGSIRNAATGFGRTHRSGNRNHTRTKPKPRVMTIIEMLRLLPQSNVPPHATWPGGWLLDNQDGPRNDNTSTYFFFLLRRDQPEAIRMLPAGCDCMGRDNQRGGPRRLDPCDDMNSAPG